MAGRQLQGVAPFDSGGRRRASGGEHDLGLGDVECEMKFRKKRADEGEGLEENRCIPKNGNVVQVGVDAERREAALNVEENGM